MVLTANGTHSFFFMTEVNHIFSRIFQTFFSAKNEQQGEREQTWEGGCSAAAATSSTAAATVATSASITAIANVVVVAGGGLGHLAGGGRAAASKGDSRGAGGDRSVGFEIGGQRGVAAATGGGNSQPCGVGGRSPCDVRVQPKGELADGRGDLLSDGGERGRDNVGGLGYEAGDSRAAASEGDGRGARDGSGVGRRGKGERGGSGAAGGGNGQPGGIDGRGPWDV